MFAMTTSKSEILGRIRAALGDEGRAATRVDEYRAIPRRYRQASALDAEAQLDLFLSRIQQYDGGVFRCDRTLVRDTIARALTARATRSLVVPPGFPREWLPDGFEFVVDNGLSYQDLDRSDGVLTTCTVAIALTGTIVLQHSPSEGRRALTLVPDYHLCVVEADQIVETVPEAMRRLRALNPSLVTTISGPSATADIEMTRIKGVHGPRTLDVILAG
jgi:L-lactate dehydrogenase complex protein LldG